MDGGGKQDEGRQSWQGMEQEGTKVEEHGALGGENWLGKINSTKAVKAANRQPRAIKET